MYNQRGFMETLKWRPVSRKRSNDISHDDPSYVRGYDLDMKDFTELVGKYNARTLTYLEECRLGDYVLTMMNMVLENPKIRPKGNEEMDGITDAMFVDGWNSLHYIKEGRKPYSYVYRSMYTAACRFYKKRISDRKKQEALDEYVEDTYAEYRESVGDGKVRNWNPDVCDNNLYVSHA